MKLFDEIKVLWAKHKTVLLFVLFAGLVIGAVTASL